MHPIFVVRCARTFLMISMIHQSLRTLQKKNSRTLFIRSLLSVSGQPRTVRTEIIKCGVDVKMALEVGEKYLSIALFGGKKAGGITIAAFPNKKKTKPTQPDYMGNGVAVWVSRKKGNNKPSIPLNDV